MKILDGEVQACDVEVRGDKFGKDVRLPPGRALVEQARRNPHCLIIDSASMIYLRRFQSLNPTARHFSLILQCITYVFHLPGHEASSRGR